MIDKIKKLLVFIGIIPLITGCNQKEVKIAVNKPAVLVITENPINISKERNYRYSGNIEAIQLIPLNFQSMEKVTDVFVDEGDFVKQGQVLAEVDSRSLESAYKAAKAKYDQAIDARNRLKKVYDAGSLQEIKWVEINSKVKQAEANRDHFKKSLENSRLTAPVDGYIAKRNIEIGMTGTQIQAPFEIVELEEVFVKVSVPENEISMFQKGQKAIVSVSALNDQVYTGSIDKVGVVANRLSRTYDIKIKINNSDLRLKPGMVCDVEIFIPVYDEVTTVPFESIVKDNDNRNFVFVVDSETKTVNKRWIEIDEIIDNSVAVSGVNSNDIIVVRGVQKLTNNASVIW